MLLFVIIRVDKTIVNFSLITESQMSVKKDNMNSIIDRFDQQKVKFLWNFN